MRFDRQDSSAVFINFVRQNRQIWAFQYSAAEYVSDMPLIVYMKFLMTMKNFKILSFVAAMFMAGCNAQATNPGVEVVSPAEFKAKIEGDTEGYLLDVRRADEFAAGHIDGAHLINWLNTDEFKKEAAGLDKSKTIYIYCRSGRRSNEAAVYLSEQGYKVVDMGGGILAWEKEGLPVTSGNNVSE